MRKLATIQKIKDIQPIPNADNIEVATVNGWDVVVKKDLYEIGENVIYCEIDSFLPIEPEFEFLRKTSYRKMSDETEGFRLKTIRMMNQFSQGLVIPLDDAQKIANRIGWRVSFQLEEVGTDVTDLLGIRKYERPIPANLSGVMKGDFPSFIVKTDEERVQNLTEEYEEWKTLKGESNNFYVTEKLDGSSFTCYIRNGEFGICSRNIELIETDDNTLWRVARELKLEEKLKETGRDISLQGEIFGEGIQGNPYKIKGQTIKFFNVFDIGLFQRLPYLHFTTIIKNLRLETVPILDDQFILPNSVNGLLEYAEGKSVLNPNVEREGIVIRSWNSNISFKVISNKFLLGERE